MILVKISSPSGDPSNLSFPKAKYLSALLLGFSFLIICLSMCSCSTTKTIPVETIKEVSKVDTIYLSNIQYDSIYINNVSYTDRSRDTLLIRETNTEYRYKLIRDTIEQIKLEVVRDSIPYEVRITETVEVAKPPTWVDKASRLCFFLVIVIVIAFVARPIIRLILKIRKP